MQPLAVEVLLKIMKDHSSHRNQELSSVAFVDLGCGGGLVVIQAAMMGVGIIRGVEIDSVRLQAAIDKLNVTKALAGPNCEFINKISFHEGSMTDPALLAVFRPVERMRMVYFLNNVTYQDELMFSILNILLGYGKEDFRVPAGSLIIMLKDVFTRPSSRRKTTGFSLYLKDFVLPYHKVGLYEDHQASKPQLVTWKFCLQGDPLYFNVFEVGERRGGVPPLTDFYCKETFATSDLARLLRSQQELIT
jgi:hypothetical protein